MRICACLSRCDIDWSGNVLRSPRMRKEVAGLPGTQSCCHCCGCRSGRLAPLSEEGMSSAEQPAWIDASSTEGKDFTGHNYVVPVSSMGKKKGEIVHTKYCAFQKFVESLARPSNCLCCPSKLGCRNGFDEFASNSCSEGSIL
jgi:hypothetical protein